MGVPRVVPGSVTETKLKWAAPVVETRGSMIVNKQKKWKKEKKSVDAFQEEEEV